MFTTIGTPATPVSAKDQDAYIYKEVTPGGTLSGGFHLNGVNIELLTDELKATVFERKQSSFDAVSSIGKQMSRAGASGAIAVNDMLYILNSLVSKQTPTVPTNNGKYILDLKAATGGTATLSFGGQTTSALANTMTATQIGNALLALSTLGRGFGEVRTLNTGVFEIELFGAYPLLGTLTLTSSLTGGSSAATLTSPNGTGLGIYRWTYSLVGSPTIQTYKVFQGLADTPELAQSAAYAFFASLGLSISESESSMTTSVVARKTQTRQTIVSGEFSDIPLVLAHAKYWNFYNGKTRVGSFGPAMLCNAFSANAELSEYRDALMSVGCNQDSFQTHISKKPNTSFDFTVMANEEGLEIKDMADEGSTGFFTMEYKGPEIVAGFPSRIVLAFPYLIESYSQVDVNGAQCLQFNGRMAQNGSVVPTMWIDTNISAL